MKATKIIAGVSALTLSAMLLTACSSSSTKKSSSSSKSTSSKVESKAATKEAGADLQDGTYKLAEKDYSNGYKAEMSMTVKDGKVTKTTLDYVNKDGKSKTKDTEYESKMKKATKTGPKEYIPALNESFTKNGANTSAIETVSGATGTSISVKNYAQQLVQAAQKGDTKEIIIDNTAKMKDGTYTLTEKNNKNGYHVTLAITVAGEKITDVKYDQVDKDGVSKTKNTEYETKMKKVNKVGPVEYIPQLQKELLESNGDLEKVEVVSGATHSSDSFIMYAAQLINAAQAGTPTNIEVDNIVYKD